MIINDNRKYIYDFLGTALVKPEIEIYDFLSHNLSDTIYTLYANNNYQNKYKSLFIDAKFLSVLNQALVNYKTQNSSLSSYDTLYIDCILYWFIVNQYNNEYTKMLWYMIANTINEDTVNRLKSLNLFDIELCNFLAIANNSSLIENVRVKRVNFTICTSIQRILSTEEFIAIYNTLYAGAFKGLLLSVLFSHEIDNVFFEQENTDRGKIAIANNNASIYAVLFMLEQMNAYDIIRLLKFVYYDYSNGFNYDSESLKISLKNLPKNLFPRILLAIENMTKEEMYLP